MNEGNRPDLIINQVIERGGDKKDVWHRVGAMFKGKGDSYLVVLHSIPLEGKMIAMPPKEDEAVEKQATQE